MALCKGQQVLASEDLTRGSASAQIVTAVQSLLAQVGWSIAELEAVGVVSGPGSFTGMRTGLAAAKGLCESAGLPLAAVSRLEVLANAAGLLDGFVALEAGRDEVYVLDIRSGQESLCSSEGIAVLCAGKSLAVAEERVAERLASCEPVLYPLHVRDSLQAVLRQMREGGSDVSMVDANYVRKESDMYPKPPMPSGAA